MEIQSREFRSQVDRLLDISLLSLVGTSFLALASTGKLDLLSVAIVSLAIICRAVLFVQASAKQLTVTTTTRLTLAYCFVYLADFFLLSGSFLSATIHLVLFVLVVKLFSLHRDRDRVYLAVITFLMLLSAAILTIDTFFLAAFIVFSLLSIIAFIAMEMRRSILASSTVAMPGGSPVKLWKLVSITATALILGILVFTPALFFALPRASAGKFQQFAQRNTFTGFGDDVTLGQIGVIQQSESVVMRVQFAQSPPADLKWHGTTLVHFDGHRWFNRIAERASVDVNGSADNTLNLNFPLARRILDGTSQLVMESRQQASTQKPAAVIQYRVNLEPMGANLFFFPSRVVWIKGSSREYSLASSASLSYRESSAMAVRAYSGQSAALDREREPFETPQPAQAYLEISKIDDRVRALAARVTANAASAYEKAVAIESYLRMNFGYTLEMQGAADPIPFFLFERKKGHCEYFASAMAVMLRMQGVPSRVVNGFRNGELSDITGSYIVRAKDAHSWVEAFIPGRGWVEFDPTPSAVAAERTLWSRVDLYLDAAREFWSDWVINYDFAHQNLLAEATVNNVRLSASSLWKRLDSEYWSVIRWLQSGLGSRNRPGLESKFWLKLFSGVFIFAVLVYGLRASLRARRIARLTPEHLASAWLARLVKRAARRGWRKLASQTAAQWAHTVSEHPVKERLTAFVAEYERARFGGLAESAQRLPHLYQEADEALRK